MPYFLRFCLSLRISSPLLICPDSSSRTPAPKSQGGALARGTHPDPPSGHLQVQRPPCLGSRGDAGIEAACPCLDCEVELKGQPFLSGFEGSSLLPTRAHGACWFGQRKLRAPLPLPRAYISSLYRQPWGKRQWADKPRSSEIQGETNLKRVGAFVRQRCY